MNVIVFALRGCPIGALGAYGNEWIATPHLDRLAAEGVVFDRHISDCPDPVAARQAWRTGRHQTPPLLSPPPQGGKGQNQDLLAFLRARGVRTVLIRHTHDANDAHPEFYVGWDDLFNARPDPADSSPIDALLRTVPAVLDRLAESSPWLLWIELDRLLPPWEVSQEVFELYIEDLIDDDPDAEPVLPWTDPPNGWFDRDDLASWDLLHHSFAAVVSVFDADLSRLFDVLRERGLDRSAAWVLTADHGLPLGEHGVLGLFRPWLHEELVHVPLIVRLPDGVEAGRRVAALTQPADLMPTIVGWLGGEAAPDDGVNLAPLIRGEVESVRPHACSGLVLDGVGEWAIRTPEWAYLLPGEAQPDDEERREPMLFEKPDDRWEASDVRSQHPEVSEELERTLRAAITPRE